MLVCNGVPINSVIVETPNESLEVHSIVIDNTLVWTNLPCQFQTTVDGLPYILNFCEVRDWNGYYFGDVGNFGTLD